MLIAHLPSGYISAHLSRQYRQVGTKTVVAATLIGAIFPDIDMVYFYLIDNQQTNHREYLTHWPLLYIALFVIAISLYVSNQAKPFLFLVWFSIAATIHMVLDSIAGPMMWLAPFSDWKLQLIEVPATQSHWILSFLFHWTFLLELSICALALLLYVWKRPRAFRA
ncbi:MAG: metal-dependent hydrolase [Proteobacteria bacterium]|nr:metal-dependent hydrolase [Pseudomonadota bacterium]